MVKLLTGKLRRALCICSVVLLHGCTLPQLLNVEQEGTASISAASYFYWAGQASSVEREAELRRLAALNMNHRWVARIQELMLTYYENEELALTALTDLEQVDFPQCGIDEQCQDYMAFAPILSELLMLRIQLRSSEEATDILEDRIRNLNQQIEALTNIEQQLLERDQRTNR